jgi:hypothetical protein
MAHMKASALDSDVLLLRGDPAALKEAAAARMASAEKRAIRRSKAVPISTVAEVAVAGSGGKPWGGVGCGGWVTDKRAGQMQWAQETIRRAPTRGECVACAPRNWEE